MKQFHEIRDPIHVFVRLDTDERRVLDSAPFQRLRHIHQLALTSQVYPAATHCRFEHSLGVMELASRVYDVITDPNNVLPAIHDVLQPIGNEDQRRYFRRVLRMAALCHDLGHIPFSHAAEKDLLPDGWNHERLTRQIIASDEMAGVWAGCVPPLDKGLIAKLAVGPNKAPGVTFTDWEAILSEVIVGDAFGVDRMDYLLRDSHHVGVAYGRFDHHRLIDTLRILPAPPVGQEGQSREPMLGLEEGGLQSAEALVLARYFMYTQVYFHPIRRVYDIHLKDFLAAWLPTGCFPTDVSEHLKITDHEVMAALLAASRDSDNPCHALSRRITEHGHFKELYRRNPADVQVNPDAGKAVFDAAHVEFGPANVRYDEYTDKGGTFDFPVVTRTGEVQSSVALSDVLQRVPPVRVEYVFVDRPIQQKAERWLKEHKAAIIAAKGEGEVNG